jgi:ribosome maturation factor RimP
MSALGDLVADTARLTEVIEPEATALGFELVRVKLSGAGDERTLQVMAEDPATGQLVVEQCMALSRRVSDRLDAIEEAGEELVDGAYNLEVSSPGIDRPLRTLEAVGRFVGTRVSLTTHEPRDGRRRYEGELLAPEGERVGIVMDGSEHWFDWPEIKDMRLVVDPWARVRGKGGTR